MAFELRHYLTADGRDLFEEWFLSIRDSGVKGRVESRLNRISLGNFGDCRSVGSGVWEFRLDFGPGYRVYYAKVGSEILLLLGGGDKRTQGKDIQTAIRSWEEFQTRENES